ncbi:ABC transporter permease [Streptosporangium saharense]|uniref:Sulfonate transport system permease protein n=1 Tax=Streptosporangium saharense TaxID=1706840 RepID=A0A7W7VRQ6_9ACTN|nr:ABC transporter permease subunit [Streptosporangium saharense]MBB4919665.1 sulfonate transport system permease protein [Streptosporangium saharense]
MSLPVAEARVGGQAVRARPRVSRSFTAWQRLLSPLAVVAVWQAAGSAGLLPERLLASPARIVSTAADLVGTGVLPEAIAVSLQRAALGFLLGALAGIGLALVAGLSRAGENALDPLLQMLRALPLFGLIPLFILWFGIGEVPKIGLVALGVLFPLYLNTFSGIRGVDGGLAELARVLRLSRTALVAHIVLPGALPQVLVGLRQSLGVAWLALIVAEQINADAGLGYMINDAREFLRTDVIVVGLIVYAILGLLTDALVRLLERRALAWRQSFPQR